MSKDQLVLKFTHKYYKMPPQITVGETFLLQVFVCDRSELSRDFVDYDVSYENEAGDCEEFELPEHGKLIVLLLQTDGRTLWSTIRRWSKEKEAYYRSMTGSEVAVVFQKE